MRIESVQQYRNCLERYNELRTGGKTPENDTEMAEIEAAITEYETHPHEPDDSKAKPTPDPFEEESKKYDQ